MKGFYLFEILFFIILSAMGLLISLPTLQHGFDRLTLKHEVNRWISRINQARELALYHHQKIILCPSQTGDQCDGNWNQFILIKNEKNNLRTFSAVEKNRMIQWHGFPIQKPYLIFLKEGLLDCENGTFTYCLNQQCKKIIISKSGRVRVESLFF